jgi:tight adherence protein B
MIPVPQSGIGPVIFLGIFLGILLIFEGIRQVLSRSEAEQKARNRRMRMIARGASAEDVVAILKPSQPRWALHAIPWIGNLPQAMRQAGLTMKPAVFLACCLTSAATIALAASTVAPVILAAAAAVLVGVVLPVFVVHKVRSRRIENLTAQLPDALDLMARGLRVGHPLNATIASVAEDMNDPIATEFGVMVDQVSYGEDLVDAFADFAERIDTEDARYLATSVAIQSGTGGDLARILATLAHVIRARIEMRSRIQAISSEGRLTSVFLSALPVLIFLVSSLTNPGYYTGVDDDPLFRPIAIAVVVLTVANFLVMRRLVNFRI